MIDTFPCTHTARGLQSQQKPKGPCGQVLNKIAVNTVRADHVLTYKACVMTHLKLGLRFDMCINMTVLLQAGGHNTCAQAQGCCCPGWVQPLRSPGNRGGAA